MRRIPLLVLGAVFVLPFAYLPLLSLSQSWVWPEVVPGELVVDHWRAMLGGNELFASFLLSLVLALSVATLATLGGFYTSRAIAHHPRRRLWEVLAYFPFVLSPVIYATLLYFFFVRFGAAGNALGVLAGQLLLAYPYAIILFLGFWTPRTQQFEQLVATLGGTSAQAFRWAIVPLARGWLVVGFFQTFLISWFEYGLTSLIGVSKVKTLTLRVFEFVNEANPAYAALSCVLLMVPPVVLLLLNRRFLVRAEIRTS